MLRLGYDGNDDHDGVLDFGYPDPTYPKEYVLNGISADIDGLSAVLCTD